MAISGSQKASDEPICVNSCGVQTIFDRNHNVERTRIDYTLMYISSGTATMMVDGKKVRLEKGDAMLFLPGAKQEYTFLSSEKAINKWIHFGGTECAKLGNVGIRKISILPYLHFEKVFGYLTDAYYGILNERKTLCNGYMMVILAIILESINSSGLNLNVAQSRITEVLNYIHNSYRETIDLNECANICYLSRDRFNHVFKQYTGLSPKEYHKKIRIDNAKQMLLDADIKISECADALGYKDTNYFCRIFKKEVGMSPTDYRVKYRIDENIND